MADVEVDYPAIERAVEEHYAGRIADNARSLAPVDSTEYISGISAEGSRVKATAPHSIVVESGAGPHVITGKPILAFQSNGMTVFARQVNHPGSPARNVIERAVRGCL